MSVRNPLFSLALLLLVLAAANPAFGETVERVIDGDTIVLASGERVRYIGIDTPESVHPAKPVEFLAKEASEFNRLLVEGKDIRLEFDVETKDKYGRLLAYVFVDTVFVNAELVRQGYAQILTIPPNVKYAEVFVKLQQKAREAHRGLWDPEAADRWVAPSPVTDPDKVYVTRTGSKYHRGGCRYLAKSAIEIARDEAVAKGYGPCSVCIEAVKPKTDAAQYYITKTGEKYHRGGCRYLARSAIPISLDDALARGYGACSVCIGASGTMSQKPSATGGQCAAITKKGTRCKRTAKAGSRYCWQHGG
jgi:micrococcal nuclease